MQHSLFTAIVFDKHRNAVPVMWALCQRGTAKDIATWLEAMVRRCRARKPDWKPNTVIVDDCDASLKALK